MSHTPAPVPATTALSTAATPADPRELRNAMGRFATGVCVVTTATADGRAAGLTVNSFSSVSLDPPLVAWCLGRHAPSMAAFAAADCFAVHVLSADQQHIAQHFARPSDNKFAAVEDQLAVGHGNVPVLTEALARFECRKFAMTDCGDHVMMIGQVERFGYSSRPPLLFHAGRFIAPAEPVAG
jgi:flavin reductase (DIM6/NTAB) family NADH-FMN oxidoreductase RutF